jgi:drug/metabolite transporter (DMT)-like permease
MNTGQVLGLAAGLAAALLFGLAAVAQAHAVRRFDTAPAHLGGFVLRSVRDPWILGVVVAYLAGFVLHAMAIWLLPLYLAQAAIATSLPVTAVTSTLLLHERLTPAHWSAVAAVTVGLVLLCLGSGDVGSIVVDAGFAVAIWVGVAVLALAGRRGSHLGGGVLGALAGLGYAGSAMAVRGVATPVDAAVAACAAAVGVYGLLAFWLYSLGLDRAPVSVATAPLIVGQTFVPGLVGVLLLGDGVRAGWWPAVVAGLVLAVGGAIFLSRVAAGPDRLRTPGAAATESSPGPAPRRGR